MTAAVGGPAEYGEGQRALAPLLLWEPADSHFAEFDFSCEVVHLQQDAAAGMPVVWVMAVGAGLTVDPGA